ncbi:MAG: magnesium transporter [bacterium]|nr:magnesium transporter [bacterium]
MPVENPTHRAFHSTSQRLPWLMITLLGGVAMTELVRQFSWAISNDTALAGFIPVMMGMSGNVAIQAATISVYSFINKTNENGKLREKIAHEIKVGALLGIAFALSIGIYAGLRFDNHRLGIAVATAATFELVAAATWGMIAPLILYRLGFDTSVALGPVVTTIADILALSIYFTTCTIIMQL